MPCLYLQKDIHSACLGTLQSYFLLSKRSHLNAAAYFSKLKFIEVASIVPFKEIVLGVIYSAYELSD